MLLAEALINVKFLLSKVLFACELFSFFIGDFGLRGMSGDVVFRVDGEIRHKFLLFRAFGGHDIHHSGRAAKQVKSMPLPSIFCLTHPLVESYLVHDGNSK